jgi:ankyrin repeat protein
MLLFAGNNELMEYLLSKGAEVDSQSDAGTPLIWAAGHGQQDALKVLLEHHANVISPPFSLY